MVAVGVCAARRATPSSAMSDSENHWVAVRICFVPPGRREIVSTALSRARLLYPTFRAGGITAQSKMRVALRRSRGYIGDAYESRTPLAHSYEGRTDRRW